jgi:Fic family protein
MERNEISEHEARIFVVLLAKKGRWLTNRQIATEAKVAERTARSHTLKLVKLGILDQAEVFPGRRFRISDKADKRNLGYINRLQSACEVFGICLA